MGCFYVGFDYKNRVNGYLKIGETGKKTPASRLAQIRQKDSFQCLGYIELQNDSKVERLFVESYVRMKLSQSDIGLTHTQNDHFTYHIESKDNKYSQAQEFANLAIQLAIEACHIANISYVIGTKTYKRS